MGPTELLGLFGALVVVTGWALRARSRRNTERAATAERNLKIARANARAIDLSLRSRR